ncbi:family 43 glycosylhydrolase [Butyrivibrio sp. FCS014]|uniref:family 43 glycosylhydrolase n=1 Tax=Butyrivibrio sp. FCS014 TaxID=1408304 RepID=UPI0004630A0B|nr:family 43 glycosylhydrolase [Butyrivibrio sp. FCS014]
MGDSYVGRPDIPQLLEAVRTGNLNKVKEILINEPSLASKEALFASAGEGHFDVLKYMVEYSRVSLNEYDERHRNVLHYGAESGNPEIFEYLTDKCGMDPLFGDTDLVTPWDIVHEMSGGAENLSHEKREGAGKIEEYLEKRYGHKYEDYYRNPIRKGFFPDPSICRVGSDYYMVNSSFIFFPCIPISHSRDLIHWKIIGHAITDPKWAGLDELEGGRGFWAPDISFYKGRFYITATYRLNDVPPTYRRQIVVFSDKPEGPYCEPVFIDEDGIDPSIFNDDDGRRYMLLNRGARIFELDETGTKKISDAKLLFYGDHKRAPEGPHLYKKDGYYYLLEAEGGTGPGHRVTISRSRELFGNYEPCPYNPIMRQQDEDAAIQRCGHGDLVDTPDGRWYMVYLCGRMIDGKYSILGRETALDPVTWTPDGWPIINNLKGPSAMQVKPFEDAPEGGDGDEIRISPCGLPLEYMTTRSFKKEDITFVTEDTPKGTGRSFIVYGSKAPLSSTACRNLVLRRQTSFSFDYEVTLLAPRFTGEGQKAGITGYYDENTFFEFGIVLKAGKRYIYCNEHIGEEDRMTVSPEPLPQGLASITFKMETDNLRRRLKYDVFAPALLLASGNLGEDENVRKDAIDVNTEKEFLTLENVYYLCDEGLSKGKRFTGALVGMYAFAGEDSDFAAVFMDDIFTER